MTILRWSPVKFPYFRIAPSSSVTTMLERVNLSIKQHIFYTCVLLNIINNTTTIANNKNAL